MLRFRTLQSPDLGQVLTFRKGDSVFLAEGAYQGKSEPSSISGTTTRSGRIFLSGIQTFAHTRSNGSSI